VKVLITGANGYIGARLIPKVIEAGHEVVLLVRSAARLHLPSDFKVTIIEGDLTNIASLEKIPGDIDLVYYLVHSMSQSAQQFAEMEAISAYNFRDRISRTKAKQIIYLSGLVNDPNLSRHLSSRKHVDEILRGDLSLSQTLMAGIIIGSGSASFEIIRDLVEKVPIMITPKWVENKTQPIAVRDVLDYLIFVLGNPVTFGHAFEIGGPDVLTYRELLMQYAKIRKLKRFMIKVPVFSPNLSSYWLYFITSASYPLARSLVESLKNNAVCKENSIQLIYPKKLLTYEEAVRRALDVIEENKVPSSWKDAMGQTHLSSDLSIYINVPENGVLKEIIRVPFSVPIEALQKEIWSLGGSRGWLYMNWAWKIRGFFDKIVGGIGLRRGRRDPVEVHSGDALDFWRVVVADKINHRLLLYAEMRLPGEAWLEFKIFSTTSGNELNQIATFRPRGLLGRLYWYMLYPLHWLIFRGMARKIVTLAK
jgi:uncharacterized protein YbjT (DUF2867 family)